jgi:putative ABC transport system permease protein
LKAIGFSNRYLTAIVLKEALYLALFGYLPGLVGAFVLYQFLGDTSGMTMRLTLPRALLVFFLAVPMCVGAGLIALRRALQTDPAEVF